MHHDWSKRSQLRAEHGYALLVRTRIGAETPPSSATRASAGTRSSTTLTSSTSDQPTWSAAELAESRRAFARQGIDHVQLVMNPITEVAIDEFAPVQIELDEGR